MESKPNKLWYLPTIITVQRLVILPFLLLSLSYQLVFAADTLFLWAIGTDFADGYAAKKLHVDSKFGAHLDATVDFLFIFGIFLYFVGMEFYSVWLLVLIGLEFGQFLVTSHFSKIVYDPVGKYYGSLLFGAIGLTLLFSGTLIFNVVTVGVSVVTAASLLSRLMYFVRVYMHKKDEAVSG
jgi:phosphatidylglycerophosphate synthase